MPKGKGYKAGSGAKRARKTRPGQVDDNALKRAKANEKRKQDALQKIFDDNETGR